MRAMVIRRRGGPEVLEAAEVPTPEPGPGQVRVRIRAASVNPIDTYLRAGSLPAPLGFPAVLGGDASGEVDAVGPGVTRWRVGDAVFGLLDYLRGRGTYAEHALFDEGWLAPRPAGLTDAEAASLPMVALTMWQVLRDWCGLAPGQRLLLHGGAGGIGSVGIPLARHLGLEVWTTCSAANAEACRALGATPIDYAAPTPFAGLPPMDAVVDAVGGYWLPTRGLVAKGGTFATLTTLADTAEQSMAGFAVHLARYAGARIAEPFGGLRVRWGSVKPNGEQLATIAGLVAEGALRPRVAEILPLAEVAEAHRRLEGRRVRGKLVLAVG